MVGRNEKCTCGSGLKYKKCCFAKQIEDANERLLNPPAKTEAQELDEIRRVSREINRRSPKIAMATIMGLVASQGDVFR